MPIREVNNSLLAIMPMCRCADRQFTIQNVNFYKYSMCLCGNIGLLKRVVNILHLLQLPRLAQSIINAYPQSPAFKNIYQYITTNTLPPNRRLQRSIISNSDNYIVADGLLFKLQQVSRNKQLVHRCLLVMPETFEHVVFHMYHDSL